MSGFDTFFADVLETFGNAALGLDPKSQDRLVALEGRSAQIESTSPRQVLTLGVHDARITLIAEPIEAPNVIVRGHMQDLLAWFAAPRQEKASPRIEIEGDETTLLELLEVFKKASPFNTPNTPNATLQNLLGAAELAIAGLRSAVEGATVSIQQTAATQYADEVVVDGFLDGLDDLRLRVDRLAARVSAQEQLSN